MLVARPVHAEHRRLRIPRTAIRGPSGTEAGFMRTVPPASVSVAAEASTQHRHVVAAAHLLRHHSGGEAGDHYRDAGEIDWFVCRPPAPFWPEGERAADQLMAACLARFARWNARVRYATAPSRPPPSTVCPATGRTSGPSTNAGASATSAAPRWS